MTEDQILRALKMLTAAIQALTEANREMLAALTEHLVVHSPKEER